jgi:L,D-transpeptidase ErfK/SrfK
MTIRKGHKWHKWRNYIAASVLVAAASVLTSVSTSHAAKATDIEPSAVESSPLAERSQGLNLVLSLSDRRVSVYSGDMLIASYEVAIGREGWNTPTGQFSVFQKQTDPAWEHPFTGEVIPSGPENPLGTRWIGFWSDGQNSIGFHGTPDESVIGSAVSHGCVRMRNDDVRALYEQVDVDTPVSVVP